jgi:hypothetical protein
MSLLSQRVDVRSAFGAGIAVGSEPEAMTHIYESDVNAAIWEREAPQLSPDALRRMGNVTLEACLTPDAVAPWVERMLPNAPPALREDVIQLADMYACLFEVSHLGLRLKTLDRPMCPRFHVDRVVCRLLTTYAGAGTEYLSNEEVDRRDLGKPVADPSALPVLTSGATVRQLPAGAVLLCKGESWPGNEGYGFVHRSPDPGGQPRLMLSIDGLERG